MYGIPEVLPTHAASIWPSWSGPGRRCAHNTTSTRFNFGGLQKLPHETDTAPSALRIDLDQALADGVFDEIGTIVEAEFGHNIAAVNVHGLGADV